MMSADAYFSPPGPRHELLKAAQGEELRDRKVVKLLRSVLVEDLYGGTTVRALSWCRDSYNDAHCMHPVLDLAPVGSKGKVWLGSVKASSNADLLEQNQILYIWPASYNPRQTQDLRKFRILPVTDGTGVMASDLELQPIMDRMLDVAQKVLQQGLSLLVCCKNGAHRSSFMLLLLLMFMSGRSRKSRVGASCLVVAARAGARRLGHAPRSGEQCRQKPARRRLAEYF